MAFCLLIYLPIPLISPIEEAFSQLKQWIKKHWTLANSIDLFEYFLRLGMEEVQNAGKDHFRKCRLGRTLHQDDDDMDDDIEDMDEMSAIK